MSLDPRANTVDGVLHRSAAKFADRTALRFLDRTWTYAELDDAVSRAAAHLMALGLERGERVAAYGTNSDAYLIGFLACCRAGLVHVPINYALRGEELSYLVGQSGAAAILVDPALREHVGEVRDDLPASVRSWHCGTSAGRCSTHAGPATSRHSTSAAEPGALVQLLYTSGTTSKPKGAMMTHAAWSTSTCPVWSIWISRPRTTR